MIEYLNPLRSKVGVIPLLIACVFMSGWIRSRYLADSLDSQAPLLGSGFFRSHHWNLYCHWRLSVLTCRRR